ncbi:MFS transporter [Streptacidiphilus sp. P02-A3a]|uniref:MFS transporter n=1 Tax=Streptacidiphilus sp. P02-A3a TaxID=2704468 RepID=UPI0015FD1D0C|nr:MFS transporter [Streptacidiphilus sp. P02-A3a]QMU72219.1 MFS transporter [Streptacidiphilus sp. P02-A3a]
MTPAPTTPDRTRWAALAVLCAGTLMIILDGTIVTVALPRIQTDLGLSSGGLAWVMNAYLIAFGGMLLLAGRLGDLLGPKRVLLAGLALFTTASLLCGLADTPALLIGGRLLQGVGGALTASVSLGMIVNLFTEPRDLRRAFAVYSFVGSAGASLGLVLGGLLTQELNWHWIFFINVPIGIATGIPAVRLLDSRPGLGLRRGADVPGALLVTSGLTLGVYAIVEHGRDAWPAALLLVGFAVRQATAADPLLPPRILRSRKVAGANLVQGLMVAALFSFQILIAQYLQHVLGFGPAATGLAMAPSALSIAAFSLGLSARLNTRFGERAVLAAGLLMLVLGLAWLTRAPVHGHYLPDVLPVTLLAGGFGLAITAVTTVGMSDATPADSGLVSGLFNTTQQLGAALGVAVTTIIAADRSGSLARGGHSPAAALTGGYRLAFTVDTGLLVAATLAVALLPGRRAAADPVAVRAATAEPRLTPEAPRS